MAKTFKKEIIEDLEDLIKTDCSKYSLNHNELFDLRFRIQDVIDKLTHTKKRIIT